jgi:aminoglycoside phosphotransferase
MARRDVVVLLRDGRVLVEPSGLPEVRTPDGYPRYADLAARVGGGFLAGPSRRLADDLSVHLVVPHPATPRPASEGAWCDAAAVRDAVTDPVVREAVARAVEEHAGTVPVPEARPAWFRPGWLGPALGWVRRQLDAAGRPQSAPAEMLRMWSLSAVLRVPAAGGPAYFKATHGHFRAEAAITRVVAGFAADRVPALLAEDDEKAWMLMDQLHGVDQHRASGAATEAAAELARLQLSSIGHLEDLVAAGCPSRTEWETLAGLGTVMADSVEAHLVEPARLEAARAVEPRLRELVQELWSLGLPATLCHGDLHMGNVAFDGRELRFFDWTDAALSHPALDAAHLARSLAWVGSDEPADAADVPGEHRVLAAYARPWREAYPGADVDRALELAAVVDHVFQAISYEGIQRSVEPVSRWETGNQVAGFLRAAPGLVAAHDGRSDQR